MSATNELLELYPEYVVRTLRQRKGLEGDDTSMDDEFLNYNRHDVFEEVVNWQGLIGYERTIKEWVLDVYGVDLEQYGKQ